MNNVGPRLHPAPPQGISQNQAAQRGCSLMRPHARLRVFHVFSLEDFALHTVFLVVGFLGMVV